MQINFKKLHPDALTPTYGTEGAAAFDLYALEAISGADRVVVKTGLAFELPKGYGLFIKSRSGLAFNQDIEAFPGTIDSDYRGEVKVLLTNPNSEHYIVITKGQRIAQAIVLPLPRITFQEVVELSDSLRGAGGFGSTG